PRGTTRGQRMRRTSSDRAGCFPVAGPADSGLASARNTHHRTGMVWVWGCFHPASCPLGHTPTACVITRTWLTCRGLSKRSRKVFDACNEAQQHHGLRCFAKRGYNELRYWLPVVVVSWAEGYTPWR